ncbi:MAG: diguanylate cyclase [Spirochaetales bacterium]|nr:diguanylate cyclase [Spirochaetales bacterium]
MRNIIIIVLILMLFPLGADELTEILVVHSYHPSLPWTLSFQEGLSRARRDHTGIEYFTEYLDTARLPNPVPPDLFASYMVAKYRGINFDAVIADSDAAARFVDANYRVSDSIPYVFYAINDFGSSPNTYVLVTQYKEALDSTLSILVTQNPFLEEIVIIESADPSSQFVYENTMAFARDIPGLSVLRISDFTIDELYQRTALFPPETVILYSPVTTDNTGTFFVPKEVLSGILAATEARVYTMWSSLMGSGAVGGCVLDGSATAREMVRAALDYMDDGDFKDDYDNLRMMFDWRALKKNGIDPELVPPGSIVLNRPVSFLSAYFTEIMIGAAGLAGLFLVTALAWAWTLKRANRKLKSANTEIDRARQTAETLARRDALTGLMNRRAVVPVITYEMKRKARANSRVSLMMLDIDHFKDVNDTYGHDAGDEVLVAVATVLESSCRNTDFPSRWGGEEFLILTPDTGGENALVVAEKIRLAVMGLEFTSASPVTVSLGVAELRAGETFDQWFQRADTCLYTAKLEGRNRCVLSTDEYPSGEASGDHIGSLLRLQWLSKYRSGNHTIDSQHKGLFEQSNLLLDEIVYGRDKNRITAILETLYDHTVRHFFSEEKILRAEKFNGFSEHRQKHKDLLRNFRADMKQYRNNEIDEYEFIKFVCEDIVLKHLIEEDVKFFPYLSTARNGS